MQYEDSSIPISFKRNSLVTDARICMITEQVETPMDAENIEIKDMNRVELTSVLEGIGESWDQIDVHCFAKKSVGRRYISIGADSPEEGLCYRTTLVKFGEGWEVHSAAHEEHDARIPGVTDPCEILTIVYGSRMRPEKLGFVYTADSFGHEDGVSRGFFGNPEGSLEEDIPSPADEEVQASAPAVVEELRDEPAVDAEAAAAMPDSIVVNDSTLTVDSALRELREACQYYNIGKSGGKKTVFERLVKHQQKLILDSVKEPGAERPVKTLPSVKVPDAGEIALRELTHMPFRNWCKHCQMHLGREDKHQRQKTPKDSMPTVSFDFCFTARGPNQAAGDTEKMIVLLLVDRDTRFVEAVPTVAKGGAKWKSYLIGEIVKFITFLGHHEVVLRSDGELGYLQQGVQQIRMKQGLRTVVSFAAKGDHQSNGLIEQNVQSVRQQCNILLGQLEEKAGTVVDTMSAVHAWAWKHACFLINRYRVQQDTTSFEKLTGTRYTGKIVRFGEQVLARVRKVMHPWDKELLDKVSGFHPGLVAGCVAASRIPRVADAVTTYALPVDDGTMLEDFLRMHTPFNAESKAEDDEAASDPPSADEMPGVLAEDTGEAEQRPAKQAKAESQARGGGDGMRSVQIAGETLFHNDDPAGLQFDEDELEVFENYDADFEDSMDKQIEASPEEYTWFGALSSLYRPYGSEEPSLSQSEMETIDELAIDVELERLTGMKVLAEVSQSAEIPEECRELSTKFVLTWRAKRIDGVNYWMRRARFVGREFQWMACERDGGLFAPASSNLVHRILPSIMMRRKDYNMMVLDFQDAFLTVNQEKPTIVHAYVRGKRVSYRLLKCLPRQRDAAAMWHSDVSSYLKEVCSLRQCAENPVLFCSTNPDAVSTDVFAVGLLHVDDLMLVGLQSELDRIEQCIEKHYKINKDRLEEGGEIWFLKRSYRLINDVLHIQPHQKHIDKLEELIPRTGFGKSRKAPTSTGPSQLEAMPEPLEPTKAATHRTCVGILLYIANDYAEAQFAIRLLATQMSKPTRGAFAVLQHVVQYLSSVKHDTLAFERIVQHGGFVVKNTTSDEPILEIMTDADWSGESITRKSVSGVALLDGHFLFFGSRTQRVVSLSSAESELYAMVSGLCDAMHLKHVILFCLGLDKLTIHHLGDSSAARGILQRQGTGGRVKHIEGRLLWSQQKIQEKIVVLNVVQTRWNLSDMAAKALSAGRKKMLKGLLGYRNEDNEPIGAEDLEEELGRTHARGAIRQLRIQMSRVMSGTSSGVAKQFLQYSSADERRWCP